MSEAEQLQLINEFYDKFTHAETTEKKDIEFENLYNLLSNNKNLYKNSNAYHNKDIALNLFRLNKSFFTEIKDEFKDFSICFLAVHENHKYFQFATDEAKKDLRLAKIAIKKNKCNIEFVGEELLENKEFISWAIDQRIPIYKNESLQNKIKNDKTLFLKVLQRELKEPLHSIHFIANYRRRPRIFYQFPIGIEQLAEPCKNDVEIVEISELGKKMLEEFNKADGVRNVQMFFASLSLWSVLGLMAVCVLSPLILLATVLITGNSSLMPIIIAGAGSIAASISNLIISLLLHPLYLCFNNNAIQLHQQLAEKIDGTLATLEHAEENQVSTPAIAASSSFSNPNGLFAQLAERSESDDSTSTRANSPGMTMSED